MSDLATYLALPYTLVLRKDEDGDFVATISELPGCMAHGSNEAEAIEALREAQAAWITNALSVGASIPAPHSEEALPSGKWLQRVPKTLHRRLVNIARNENTSLNQLVTAMLSEAVSCREHHGLAEFLAETSTHMSGWGWEGQLQAGWVVNVLHQGTSTLYLENMRTKGAPPPKEESHPHYVLDLAKV